MDGMPHLVYNNIKRFISFMTLLEHKRELNYSNDFPWQQNQGNLKEEAVKATKKQKAMPNGFGEVLYGRSLTWYKDVALWPMFILLIIELGARVIQTKYLPLWNEEIFSYVIYFSRLVLFSYLGIFAIKQYKASKTQAIIAATLGGLIAGFLLAVFQLFWYFELWTFFNIIGQPLLMAAMGVVITWLVSTIFYKR